MYFVPGLWIQWTVFLGEDEKWKCLAGLICDVYTTEGEPFAGDPRGKFENELFVTWKKLDSNPSTLVQSPEFFLFKLDENGDPTLEVNDKGGYFDLAPTDLADNTRREIVNVLTQNGI
ncbi:glutamate-ammonia ligase [Streptococcus pneumoniae]|nr:glutamate-ammonia ligase [Streptococcus pneumoniae]